MIHKYDDRIISLEHKDQCIVEVDHKYKDCCVKLYEIWIQRLLLDKSLNFNLKHLPTKNIISSDAKILYFSHALEWLS